MTYNPDDPKEGKIIPLKKPPEIDKTTQSMYVSYKDVYKRVKDSLDKMLPAQRKHFDDMALFIKKYESGEIKHWWEFFKRK